MDQKCPICNSRMIRKNVNGQVVYVCPTHSSMKNILTSIAEESNNEIAQYFPNKRH